MKVVDERGSGSEGQTDEDASDGKLQENAMCKEGEKTNWTKATAGKHGNRIFSMTCGNAIEKMRERGRD